MEIVYDDATLRDYIGRATDISPEHPVLVDRFLDDAIEIDVDALCDADRRGVPRRRHGAHRGGRHPLRRLGLRAAADHARPPHLAEVRRYTEAIARGVGVRGLLNVQYALKDDTLYVLEANPRASRTVPFVSKATAVPLAKAAAGSCSARPSPTAGRGPAAGRPATAGGCRRRADRGQGGGAAVQAVPHPGRQGRGHPARPGDEVHRRGDGHRHGVRARLRQVAGRRVRLAADRRAGSSSRWPTGTSAA